MFRCVMFRCVDSVGLVCMVVSVVLRLFVCF